jgi:hypothetical protein
MNFIIFCVRYTSTVIVKEGVESIMRIFHYSTGSSGQLFPKPLQKDLLWYVIYHALKNNGQNNIVPSD